MEQTYDVVCNYIGCIQFGNVIAMFKGMILTTYLSVKTNKNKGLGRLEKLDKYKRILIK